MMSVADEGDRAELNQLARRQADLTQIGPGDAQPELLGMLLERVEPTSKASQRPSLPRIWWIATVCVPVAQRSPMVPLAALVCRSSSGRDWPRCLAQSWRAPPAQR